MRKNIIISIITLFLILFLLFIFVNDKRRLTFIENGIKETFLYFEKVINEPFKLLINSTSEKCNDNEVVDITKYKETLKELNDLKKTLDLENSLIEYDKINCYTINRNIGLWYKKLTLDKGKSSGISKNMAVITKSGLIGKVIRTTNKTSSVKLLTAINRNSQISVKIEVDSEYLYGLLTDYKDGLFTIEGITDNREIKKGTLVTTTGLDNIYPSGILVGIVVDSKKDSFDLVKTIYIKSKIDFDNINYVSVIKRSEIK